MDRKRWQALFLFLIFWIFPVSSTYKDSRVVKCLTNDHNTTLVFAGKYNGFIRNDFNDTPLNNSCLITMQYKYNTTRQSNNTGVQRDSLGSKLGLKLKEANGYTLLVISKHIVKKGLPLCVLSGKHCREAINSTDCLLNQTCSVNVTNRTATCSISCFITNTRCPNTAPYKEGLCEGSGIPNLNKTQYIINITESPDNCYRCKNRPIKLEGTIVVNEQLEAGDGKEIDPAKAVEFLNKLDLLVANMNSSATNIAVGSVKGVLVKQNERDNVDEVSFGFTLPNASALIVDRDGVSGFSSSVSISKEAFEKAFKVDSHFAYVGLFRFNNMAKDEVNSTVLYNDVLAIEMGSNITNLTDKISICFQNVSEKGIPTCRSWNGEGGQPNWTENGCDTLVDGDRISCHCTHLTFFAVILTPLNVTIPHHDLISLTYITYVGCGLSLFFLGLALFMHFLLRRAKAIESTQILIQLMAALLLLNLSFLTNTWVADLHQPVGCRVIAVAMHYSMLATFTWFAMNAFHLCLSLYPHGKVVIHRYILKVSIAGWVLPSIGVIILLILGKYGELVIPTDVDKTTMCWITDSELHYIFNITYYALVFLFTFTTFTLIIFWLFITKKRRCPDAQMRSNSVNMFTIFGLFCMLGITWGIAFFAHGVLLIPAYYVFTILNSFHGFFLYIYYYNSSRKSISQDETSISGSSNVTKYTLDVCDITRAQT